VSAQPERFQPMETHRLLVTGIPVATPGEEELGEVAVISTSDDTPITDVPHAAQPALDTAPKLVVGPNPFRGSLTLRLVLARPGATVVDVLDMAGRMVRRIHAGTLGPGATQLEWDGRAASGRLAPSGLYLVRVRQGERDASAKVLRLR